MNKKNFFKSNPVGDLVEELKEQEMNKSAGANNDSIHLARKLTLKGEGWKCTHSAECNNTKACGIFN